MIVRNRFNYLIPILTVVVMLLCVSGCMKDDTDTVSTPITPVVPAQLRGTWLHVATATMSMNTVVSCSLIATTGMMQIYGNLSIYASKSNEFAMNGIYGSGYLRYISGNRYLAFFYTRSNSRRSGSRLDTLQLEVQLDGDILRTIWSYPLQHSLNTNSYVDLWINNSTSSSYIAGVTRFGNGSPLANLPILGDRGSGYDSIAQSDRYGFFTLSNSAQIVGVKTNRSGEERVGTFLPSQQNLVRLSEIVYHGGSLTGKITPGYVLFYTQQAKLTISPTNRTVYADTSGNFFLRNLQNRDYSLKITQFGCRDTVIPITISDNRIDTMNISLTRIPVGSLRISVVNDIGTPLTHIDLEIVSYYPYFYNADSVLQVDSLPIGRYSIRVGVPGFPIYSDSVTINGNATTSLTIRKPRQYTKVIGEVTDWLTDQPIPNVLVTSTGTNQRTFTDTDGQYILDNVLTGSQSFFFSKNGSYSSDTVSQMVWGNNSNTQLNVQLKPQLVGGMTMLSGHTDLVTDVKYSHSGSMLASSSNDGTVKLWSTYSGALLRTLPANGHEVTCVAFSATDKYVAAGTWDDSVRIWRTSDGELVHTILMRTNSLAFNPNGSQLILVNDRGISARRTDDWSEYYSIDFYDNLPVCFNPSGSQFLSPHDHQLSIFNSSDMSYYSFGNYWHNPTAAGFNSTGSLVGVIYDQILRIYIYGNESEYQEIHYPYSDEFSITAMSFFPNVDLVASTTSTGKILFWDVIHNWDEIHNNIYQSLNTDTDCLTSLAISPTGHQMAACGADNRIRIWQCFP